MKTFSAIVSLTLLLTISAFGQTDTPKADIFGGYAYGSIDGDIIGRLSAHGGGFSVTGNFSRALGITGEYTYGHGNISTRVGNTSINTDFSTNLFLAGPRIHGRAEKGTLFGHALFGVAKTSVGVNVPGLSVNATDTNFAMGFGAGADYNVTQHVAIRVIQGDYIPVKSGGIWSHNFRIMAGIVFRIGN
jgi:opacity protein-like surface antigen